MKEHIKRRIEYSKDIAPEEGTPEYEAMQKIIQQHELKNPNFRKEIKRRKAEATKTWELQEANGIGFNLDRELRYYLGEFNRRSWAFGHRSMPIMFNIMEAFFTLDKRLNYWTLLDEEDYSISFFDFIDYYTSNDFKHDTNEIVDNFQEDLIYNFHVQYDLKEIKFSTDEGETFIIAGVSMVRRGNEVSMLFSSGQIINTIEKTAELEPIDKANVTKGREQIVNKSNNIREAVKLNEDSMLWEVLVACRFDLESSTLDARYIAKDEGDSYSITTDDITGFVTAGKWRDSKFEELFKSLIKKVEAYNPIFELAKACLFLPHYFNFYDSEIEEESIDTSIKAILKNSLKSKEFKEVKDKFKIRSRTLWKLDRNKVFLSNIFKLRNQDYKIETSGYWRKLENDEDIGKDKKGNSIIGKTWVEKTESFYESKLANLIVEREAEIKFNGPNAGRIYIMRNSTLPKNVFKIGLTKKETDERASQLSDTSIPDRYYVMREWNVKDCYLAERTIHKLLENKRVDSRREFFLLDMRVANDVIDSVVEDINKNNV